MTVKDFGSVTDADTGLWLPQGTGDITVENVGTVKGTAGDGILASTAGGGISIQSTGTTGGITGGGRDGINANALGGDIAIGTTKANGAITGAGEGIEARTSTETENYGAGLAARYSSSAGFYAALLGAVSWPTATSSTGSSCRPS